MPTYYTPTVEDLVWGLEYESLGVDLENGGTKWEKGYCDAYKGSVEFLDYIFRCPTKLRIKHLDEDDIIELGWVKANDFIYRIKNYAMQLHDSGKIAISDNGSTIYWGICRNKAELKRLTNNLSITK